MIVEHPNDNITMLDYEDGGHTLRELVIGIQSNNKNIPGNLFHAVVIVLEILIQG